MYDEDEHNRHSMYDVIENLVRLIRIQTIIIYLERTDISFIALYFNSYNVIFNIRLIIFIKKGR